MLALTGYGGLLAAANWFYWIFAAFAVWWAWRRPAGVRTNVAVASGVAAVFLCPSRDSSPPLCDVSWEAGQGAGAVRGAVQDFGGRVLLRFLV